MFSRHNHPYIQLDESFLDTSYNPDYDTSRQSDNGIQLQDLGRFRSLKRHPYKALGTPTANLEQSTSPLRWPSSSKSRPQCDTYKPLPAAPRSRWSGWRFTVASGSLASVVVLICNIALLGWSYNFPRSNTNNILLYQGDCGEMKRIDTLSHLLINVLSTILLAASNYAMQVLVAPTRANVDKAHPLGKVLDIGISGFGNWRFMGWNRRICWLSLTLSTIPLHLLYNSVIFSTTSAINYQAYVVSQDFLGGAPYSSSDSSSTGVFFYSGAQESGLTIQQANKTLLELYTKANNGSLKNGSMQNMTNSDCIAAFNQNYVPNYASVLLVTNMTRKEANGSLLNLFAHQSALATSDLYWFCGAQRPLSSTCNPAPTNFTLPYYSNTNPNGNSLISGTTHVQYCLANPAEPHCTVELIPGLLYAVILCNVIKGLAFAYLTFLQFDPLITIGQAVASFLENPDPTTEGLGAHSARDVRGEWLSNPQSGTYWSELNQDHIYKSERRRWFSGASPLRWFLTLLACLSYWLVGLSLLLLIQYNGNHLVPTFAVQWALGFGAVIPSELASVTHDPSWNIELLENVLLANFPQIILSFVYVSYNGLFTCMLLSREWVSYARSRKGLRVHWPRGAQRATYWLSLPYRYSMPLLVTSGLIHWLLSQSIFVAQVNIYSIDGDLQVNESVNAIGWSELALTLLLTLGGAMILTILGFGFLRYRRGIPIASSNSRAISAACHPVPGRFEESTQRLQYGIISELGDGRYHVGFSSREVKPLVEGDYYE